jgi:hypothetical protein
LLKECEGRVLETKTVDRIVDVASVVLISVAAVLSALCGYQSGRWGGQQARLYNVANAYRIESAEEAGRSNALIAIDVSLFLQYIDAVDARDERKAQFIYERLRPEMRPAMAAWLAAKPLANTHAPTSPFVMRQYSLRTKTEARRLETLANRSFAEAQKANRHSDDFLLLTVIFAGVSFLAGMSTKMVYPRHAIVIGVGVVGLIYGGIRLAELPFL